MFTLKSKLREWGKQHGKSSQTNSRLFGQTAKRENLLVVSIGISWLKLDGFGFFLHRAGNFSIRYTFTDISDAFSSLFPSNSIGNWFNHAFLPKLEQLEVTWNFSALVVCGMSASGGQQRSVYGDGISKMLERPLEGLHYCKKLSLHCGGAWHINFKTNNL